MGLCLIFHLGHLQFILGWVKQKHCDIKCFKNSGMFSIPAHLPPEPLSFLGNRRTVRVRLKEKLKPYRFTISNRTFCSSVVLSPGFCNLLPTNAFPSLFLQKVFEQTTNNLSPPVPLEYLFFTCVSVGNI